MKPIEPGCMAIVLYDEHAEDAVGLCVHVERVGIDGEKTPSGHVYGDTGKAWLCLHENLKADTLGRATGYAYYAEEHLMRIDGYTEEEKEEALHNDTTI